MAESPAHKFGQLIGEILELVLRPQLELFCTSNSLYLDHQKKIRPARLGKKVSWTDNYGNTHDLDFVIERGGNDQNIGLPMAFIECAWRRYTKHSRNKAQEIQGAILPLAEKYKWNNPFLGAVLGGVFTDGSLEQLTSLGFSVLFIPYNSIVSAFKSQSIYIEFEESTPDSEFSIAINKIESLSSESLENILSYLITENQNAIDAFFQKLKRRLSRQIIRVIVIPLYGRINEFISVEAAIKFLDMHLIYEGSGEFRKYELHIDFPMVTEWMHLLKKS